MHNPRGRGRGRGFHRRANNEMQPHYQRQPQQHQQQQSRQVTRDISKHDNNCCREITICLNLEESEEVFFQELKSIWTIIKNSPQVVSKLHNFFNSCPNPYIVVLRLLYNCHDFFNAKNNSLPHFIIKEFNNWSTISRNKILHLLTDDLKIDAFKVINKHNGLVLKKVVFECYEFQGSKDMFIGIIKCMLEKYQYREAGQFATLLKLNEEFTIHDFLVPLILQDKHIVVEEFLEGNPKMQTELVLWMDSILGTSSVSHTIMDYVLHHRVQDIKLDKIHGKPWKKLIARFVKMYKLPPELTPNLVKKRNEGALQFILQKKFIEKAFSDDSFREMVQEAVGNDEEMQKELIYQVSTYGDQPEALRWAHFYNVSKDYWPHQLRAYEELPDGKRHQVEEVEECWNTDPIETVDYHKFALPFDCIHLIDSEETFVSFLDTGLQDVDIVGIDCEWKPSFGNHVNELALMQLATRKYVFILDIVNLGNKVPHLWQDLGKILFSNCDILKLGFNFTSDITMIRTALRELNFTAKQVGFLDLGSLWKQLDRYPKVQLPFEVKSGGCSLTTLVQLCMGKPLDKSDQFSNWEKRPLRDNQLIYAALDSYCLIEVYDVLKRCCESAGFPFEEVCYNLMTNQKMHKKKPKKPFQKKQGGQSAKVCPQPPSPHVDPTTPDRVKVVCDTMLQGLAKNLRRVGVDCAVLENNQDHMECVRYAQDQDRFILTKGIATFQKLNGYVPQGYCLRVVSDDVDQQLKEVLDYYKINVTKDYIFSRCQACNGNYFIKVSKSTILSLVETMRGMQDRPQCYEDEATGFTSEEDNVEEAGYTVRRPVQSSNTRKWDICTDTGIDVGLCRTKSGQAHIQVLSIPSDVIHKNDFFFVCDSCGKVFWDGSHFERVLQGRLKGIVQ